MSLDANSPRCARRELAQLQFPARQLGAAGRRARTASRCSTRWSSAAACAGRPPRSRCCARACATCAAWTARRAAREGPWATYARMEILRSPKHLTGPDLGVPSLTYRAWHEAKFGADALGEAAQDRRASTGPTTCCGCGTPPACRWRTMSKLFRLNLKEEFVEVQNERHPPCTREKSSSPSGAKAAARCAGRRSTTFDPAQAQARRVPFRRRHRFQGAEGQARRHPRRRLLRLRQRGRGARGGRGGSGDVRAPAVPAAGEQVEVDRLPRLPARLRVARRRAAAGASTPTSSASRCRRRTRASCAARSMQGFRCGFRRVGTTFPREREDRRQNPKGHTPSSTPSSSAPASTSTCSTVPKSPRSATRSTPGARTCRRLRREKFPEEARFPYLGDAFQLQGKAQGLGRVHVFNWGSTMSHGALGGDIPGIETGARRLAQGIARDLFLEDARTALAAPAGAQRRRD